MSSDGRVDHCNAEQRCTQKQVARGLTGTTTTDARRRRRKLVCGIIPSKKRVVDHAFLSNLCALAPPFLPPSIPLSLSLLTISLSIYLSISTYLLHFPLFPISISRSNSFNSYTVKRSVLLLISSIFFEAIKQSILHYGLFPLRKNY